MDKKKHLTRPSMNLINTNVIVKHKINIYNSFLKSLTKHFQRLLQVFIRNFTIC